MHKTWHKAFHKRKAWKAVSKPGKLVYYMQPLVEHYFDIWMQPMPFPTIIKFMYSCVVLFFIMLPILYPLFVLMVYYGIFLYVGEEHFGLVPPPNWDLLGAANHVWRTEVTNKKYLLFVTMYIDRYRVILTAISSTVDYMRMALCFIFS
ncbi:uncharacterized protein LOC119551264 isoform X2 [Drosophila subpulchrella]|uniref:uncharacterized protein LOC119551264 isoform X2 n=1 Tax=Drosophila subpulchrella TaxID=1486046 RepID=UPI0018A1AD81|nr:uncharacterized protein LOC119551264 isoform X2 [Drosophila subpulchrella]